MFESFLQFDLGVFQWVSELFHNGTNPVLDFFFGAITILGDAGIISLVIGFALLLPNKTRKIGAVILIAMLFDVLICNGILKNLFERVRPYNLEDEWWREAYLAVFPNGPLTHLPSSFSFPSGHTAGALSGALACLAAAMRAKWGGTKKTRGLAWGFVVVAVLIGFSRIYLGVHYCTDVLGGVLVGILCAALAALVFRFVEPLFEKLNAPVTKFVNERLPKCFH